MVMEVFLLGIILVVLISAGTAVVSLLDDIREYLSAIEINTRRKETEDEIN